MKWTQGRADFENDNETHNQFVLRSILNNRQQCPYNKLPSFKFISLIGSQTNYVEVLTKNDWILVKS